MDERINYAKIWLKDYAPPDAKFEFKKILSEEDIKKLSDEQKKYLREIAGLVEKTKSAEELEKEMYNLAQKMVIKTTDAFAAVYLVLIGKTHGPKAAWLVLGEKEKALKRFKEITG